MRNALKSTIDILIAVGVGFLAYACVLFIRYNAPIIKHDFYFAAALALNLLLILISLSGSGKKYSGGITIFNFFFSIIISALIFYSILDAVVYHRFQPIYQYDRIIYAAIIGFALLVTAVLIQSFQALRHIARPMVYPKYIWIGLLIVLLPIQFYGFRLLKKDADYTYIETEPTILFDSADSGYSSFRKPSLLIIHAGETLADGTILTQDRVIVFAEGVSGQTVNQRKTRLIGKMSLNGGTTWQDSSINGDYADIMDGAGNAVSVFDAETGEAFVFYIKEAYPDDYRTYLMKSRDGGISWETAGYVFDGVSSPGHGIQINNGPYAGWLVVPVYAETSCVLYSDDHGETWQQGGGAGDGNECEVVQIAGGGQMMMVLRPNVNASTKHEKLTKQYAISVNGGSTWSSLKPLSTFRDPVCMSSIIGEGNVLYYAYPNDYFNRARMTIARSRDCGKTWAEQWLIYNGPSGYSDIGMLSDGRVMLLFENGAVAYNERIVQIILDTSSSGE